jgi:hypothetical protein
VVQDAFGLQKAVARYHGVVHCLSGEAEAFADVEELQDVLAPVFEVWSRGVEPTMEDFEASDGALALKDLMEVRFWSKCEARLFNCLRFNLVGTIGLSIRQKNKVSAIPAICGEAPILWIYLSQRLLTRATARTVGNEIKHSLLHDLARRKLGKASHIPRLKLAHDCSLPLQLSAAFRYRRRQRRISQCKRGLCPSAALIPRVRVVSLPSSALGGCVWIWF